MNTPAPFFQGSVLPDGQTFDAWPEQSLLDSMEQGGIAWPSSCRSGFCRTCICKVVEGQVHYEAGESSLSPEEQQEGWALPCMARPAGHVVLKDAFGE